MQSELRGAAWALGVWGALSIIFGLVVLAWPGITIGVFLVILALYLIVSGIAMLIGSLVNHEGRWIGGALIGLISLVAGLYVFAHPDITALVILTVIAIWAIAVGVLEIVAGVEANKKNWLLVISGAIYTMFGFYIFANPKGGAIALIWLIGLSVIAGGIVLVISSFEAHKLRHQAIKTK